MLRTLLFIINVSLISFSLNAQSFTGTILDSKSNPVPYATIQIGENYGVVSNQEGVFSINLNNRSDTDIVTISFLGYKDLELTVKEFTSKDIFTLEEDTISLDQAFITNKEFTPIELIEKVMAYRDSNYTKDGLQRKVFLRKSSRYEPQKVEIKFKRSTLFSKKTLKEVNQQLKNEGIKVQGGISYNFQEYLVNYLSNQKSSKTQNIKSTFLINESSDASTENISKKMQQIITSHLSTERTYKVKTGLFTVDDSLEINVKQKEDKTKRDTKDLNSTVRSLVSRSDPFNYNLEFLFETKRYNYEIENVISFNDEFVYVITFQPKRKAASYQGKLFINTDDFAIMKMEYQIAPDRDGSKMNLKLLLGVKFVEQDASHFVIYKKDETLGKYFPQLITKEQTMYSYVNRPFKFTENKIDDDEDKKMLKFNILLENIETTSSELYFLEKETISSTDFENFTPEEHYKIDYIEKYDPAYWKGLNLIEPVKLLKEYKTK